MSAVLRAFWALCVGMVGLFAFFVVMGGFAPGDVLWLTLIVAALGALFLIHQMRVRHELSEHHDQDDELLRQVQRIRERRGF
jgi:hypothetical protein